MLRDPDPGMICLSTGNARSRRLRSAAGSGKFPVLAAIGLAIVFVSALSHPAAAGTTQLAAEPGWLPVVFARGTLRDWIEATPIELRPYRPLHVYGNTVRRMHYRGTPWPQGREVIALPVRVLARGRNQPWNGMRPLAGN